MRYGSGMWGTCIARSIAVLDKLSCSGSSLILAAGKADISCATDSWEICPCVRGAVGVLFPTDYQFLVGVEAGSQGPVPRELCLQSAAAFAGVE